MKIDWTQTLLGQGLDDPETGGGALLRAAKIGRLAGAFSALLLFASAMILAASRGIEASLPLIAGSAGLLVLMLGGLMLMQHLAGAGRLVATALPLLFPFMAGYLGLSPVAAKLFWLLLLLDLGLACSDARGLPAPARFKREIMVLLLFALFGMLAAFAGIVAGAGRPDFVAGALLFAAGLPRLAATLALLMGLTDAAALRLQADEARPEAQQEAPAILAHLLEAAKGIVLIVDAASEIDAKATRHALSQPDPAPSDGQVPPACFTDRVLIADRPRILHALSQAIHAKRAIADCPVRLLRPGSARLRETPLRYDPYRVFVTPLRPGRALLLAFPETEIPLPAPIEAGPPGEGAIDPALLARALHDAVSPFNAGLGYLELLGDASLAPTDPAMGRSHAREARRAMIEAHRNTLLLGRWLKLGQRARAAQPQPIAFAELLQDALRAFQLLHPAGGAETEIVNVGVIGQVLVDAEAARFALLVFLRRATRLQIEGGAFRLHLTQAGQDIQLSFEAPPDAGRGTTEDGLQTALETAASRFLAGKLAWEASEGLHLRFFGLAESRAAWKSPLSQERIAS